MKNNTVPSIPENPFYGDDPFAIHNQFELESVACEYARVSMQVAPHHKNHFGAVHGGAIFALADFALAHACNSTASNGVGLQVSINYLANTSAGKLIAECRRISDHNRINTYITEVKDQNGQLMANIQALSYRLSRSPIT